MDLSLILCSRNDAYMGNSRWRLETTLNGIAERVARIGRSASVEILVADWGSETPLADVVALEPAARAMVSFVTIPPVVARAHQGDSPFPEVIALNAVARRARGRYIGRIDQDTIVGERFLRWFFDGPGAPGVAADATSGTPLYFANRRGIPFRLAAACPDRRHVDRFLRWFGSVLPVWRTNPSFGDEFWSSWVGIWLAHRTAWHEAGGYDERMIFYNWMETDMIRRLSRKHRVVDLGRLTGYDFFHLDHADPRQRDRRADRPRRNPDLRRTDAAPPMHPNGPDWGLAGTELAQGPAGRTAAPGRRAPGFSAARELAAFVRLMAWLALALAVDAISMVFARSSAVARRRIEAARRGVAEQPLRLWPATLWKLWMSRKVNRAR